MLSTTEQQTVYGELTLDDSAENKANGLRLINENIRQVCSEHQYDFLEKTKTYSTVADQQFYDLPADYNKLISLYVAVGTTRYVPREVPTRRFWDELNSQPSTSDEPYYRFIFGNQFGLFPTPATSLSNAMVLTYRLQPVNLSVEDYTTGNITDATNGSKTIEGSGTSWTSAMVGRWLRITGETGDHRWYQIESVTDADTLVLEKAYEGTSISGGSAAYTIGEMSILPAAFHMLPVYYAAHVYFATKNIDNGRAQKFADLYSTLLTQLKGDHGRKTNSVVIEDDEAYILNPNLAPRDVGI
jgi:hypothetical protein